MKRYLRRAGRVPAVRKIVAALAFFGLAVAAGWYTSEHSRVKPAAKTAPGAGRVSNGRPVPAAAVHSVPDERRKVYPFSIVAGGARTVEEAKRAMSDPAVKAHYAGVDLGKLKQQTLTADISGYVSYRFGDQIYWTAKRVVLKAGETVYTDGNHIVRGRCLNRYSAQPMVPTRPNGPSEKAFDSPVEVRLVALTSPPPLPPLSEGAMPLIPLKALTPSVPVLPVSSIGSGAAAGAAGGGFLIPPIFPIIPPIQKHSPRHPSPESSETQSESPPAITAIAPEPDYRWVLAGALICLAVAGQIRSRRSRSRS